MQNPISEEFAGADLGDPRRTRRLGKLADSLMVEPSAGFPQLMDGDAEMEGLYRFLNNSSVSMDAILEPHFGATVRRLPAADFVVAHDTTEFRFDGRAGLEDLGRLREEGSQGFFGHFSFAITEPSNRRPQGLLELRLQFRDRKPGGPRKHGDISPSEADKWWQSVDSVAQRLGEKKRHAIHVMDREADSYAILARLIDKDHRFVIRAAHKDRTVQLQEGFRDAETKQLQEALRATVGVCKRNVKLSRRKASGTAARDHIHKPREMRAATLRFSARQLFARRGDRLRGTDIDQLLSVNVVDVHEENAPEGCDPVRWILLTTEPVSTPDEVERVVDAYHSRWLIEEYFKALKTGCSFEKRQLKSRHALCSSLALFSVIAWRLLLLRSCHRNDPSLPATSAFEPAQLTLLSEYNRMRGKSPLPAKPSVEDALTVLAHLGGHLKHNGKPGWQILGRGYEKLLLMQLGWRAHAEAQQCRQV
jgi:hypothetical protein